MMKMLLTILMKFHKKLRSNSICLEIWEFIKLISNKLEDVIFPRNDHDQSGMDKISCQINSMLLNLRK